MHTSLSIRAARRRDESGAAAVEFALVVPFLLLIVFGIIVYGMVFAQSLSLSNSARQAARSGVISGTTCDQITSLAHDAADTIGMDGADTTVSIKRGATEATASAACGGGGSTQPCKSQAVGTNIYVTLTFSPDPIIPFVPVPSTLQGKGVYRCEFQ
jgi:Flp pilus assembly protein TadG